MARDWKREVMDARRTPFPEYPRIIALIETVAEGATGSEHHSHPWAEMNILLEGRGVWCAGDDEFEVKQGDAFLLLPGTLHHTKWPEGTGFRAGTIDFEIGPTPEVSTQSSESRDPNAPGVGGMKTWLLEALIDRPYRRVSWDAFPEWWQRFCDEQEAPAGRFRALRVESGLQEVLARFADPDIEQPDWRMAERRGLDRAMRYMVRKMAEGPVTVAEMARVAGMSRSKFADQFREVLGTPPHAYATALRIWMAEAGLAGSNASAVSISESLGFSSPQHFSRVFKATTGLTPQEYRSRWGAPWVRHMGAKRGRKPKEARP
ncbi:MAG: helix-turn-helix domain-containing protein [Verrucomicrobia bacterium]|nr:helix-turn-helix domain-containing protein [Verrucomicrobiota bacterium]